MGAQAWPQLPASASHSGGRTMQSRSSAAQLSPVATRNSSSRASGKVVKLAWAFRSSRHTTWPNSSTPEDAEGRAGRAGGVQNSVESKFVGCACHQLALSCPMP